MSCTSLKTDAATGASQLVSREGATGSDVPVVDHLVGLRFDYYGDPAPPVLIAGPSADPAQPRATYGPAPPTLLNQGSTGGYPAGESCTFAVDLASLQQVSRLPALDGSLAANGLVLLTQSQLTDGPWCPDPMNANRWDADLLSIRTIAVTARIQAADMALRGPAGILFTQRRDRPERHAMAAGSDDQISGDATEPCVRWTVEGKARSKNDDRCRCAHVDVTDVGAWRGAGDDDYRRNDDGRQFPQCAGRSLRC